MGVKTSCFPQKTSFCNKPLFGKVVFKKESLKKNDQILQFFFQILHFCNKIMEKSLTQERFQSPVYPIEPLIQVLTG